MWVRELLDNWAVDCAGRHLLVLDTVLHVRFCLLICFEWLEADSASASIIGAFYSSGHAGFTRFSHVKARDVFADIHVAAR